MITGDEIISIADETGLTPKAVEKDYVFVEDIQVTEGLTKAAEILGIRVLDHIVFSSIGHRPLMNAKLAT